MTQVKICGLTRLDDALAALEAGADYLGFIFYPPSPRAITPIAAAALVARLRAVAPQRFAGPNRPYLVGVFVNESPAAIATALTTCGLDLAQLSGDEPPDAVANPASPIFGRAYKALRSRGPAEAKADSARYLAPDSPSGPRLLLDTPNGRLYGGTGQTGDWALAALLAAPRLMLAGGLTPDNVADAVAYVRPFAVDVAGGVESAPGHKDPDRVRAFIAAAKGA